MRTIAFTLLLNLALLGGHASAQSGLLDLAGQGCRIAGHMEGFEWICYAADLVNNVTDLITGLHGEMSAFGQELFSSWLNDSLAAIGTNLNTGQVAGVLGSLNNALQEGPAAFRQAIRDAVGNLRRAAERAPRSPRDSPDWWYEEATRSNPNLVAGHGILNAQQDQLIETRGEAAAVHEFNVQLAGQVAESTAIQDGMAQVLRPSLGGVGGGDAARLEDAARTAVSTRAAIQSMTEGMANLMRHQAVFSGSISESLRVLAQQQTMTTWELQLAVNTLTQQLEMEIARERAALQAEIYEEYEAGRQLGVTLGGMMEGTLSVLRPDADDLRFENLGW
jgi:hypothetical protein